MFVKPAPDRHVVYPETGLPFPAEGGNVLEDAHWLRALEQGDIMRVDFDAVAKPMVFTDQIPDSEFGSAK